MKYITETRDGQSTVGYLTYSGNGLCYNFVPDRANATQWDDDEAEKWIAIINATSHPGFSYQIEDVS